MTKTLLQNASGHIQTSISYLNQHKPLLLTLLLSPLIPLAYLDYQGWYNLGAGGLPHNALGWLMQSFLRLCAGRNLRDAKPYDVEILTSELEKTSFLRDRVPAREGKSPKTGKWVAPHRQLEQGASAEIKTALEAEITLIANLNPQTLELGPSKLEGAEPALFIREEIYTPNHSSARQSPREVFHLHCAAEGSCHAVLSAADAKLVLEKGWGERHGLSGRGVGVPLGYVMVFAPRCVEEVGVIGMVARAAARYGLEGGDVE